MLSTWDKNSGAEVSTTERPDVDDEGTREERREGNNETHPSILKSLGQLGPPRFQVCITVGLDPE